MPAQQPWYSQYSACPAQRAVAVSHANIAAAQAFAWQTYLPVIALQLYCTAAVLSSLARSTLPCHVAHLFCCKQATTRKTRILDVVYNSSNNELVRTQTLVKNAIIQIDATPFRQWYNQHYGVEVGLKKKLGAANVAGDEAQVHTVTEQMTTFHYVGSSL